MKNYCSFVSRKPPEGLLAWALQDGALSRGGFIYEKVWDYDESIDAILTGTVRKRPYVFGKCSECGQKMRFEYAPKEQMYQKYKPVYGFWTGYGTGCCNEVVTEGDECECPICGAHVKVFRAARAGYDGAVTDTCFVTSADLLEGSSGKRPLVLTSWRMQMRINRDADARFDIDPIEAYVFEEKDACRLNGWVMAYGGNTGFFMTTKREWSQQKKWMDEMGTVGRIFGLTKELVEESCLYNSKLDIAMDVPFVDMNPVAYLRLYQMYPQVENLVVQGGGHIIARMFDTLMELRDIRERMFGPDLRQQEKNGKVEGEAVTIHEKALRANELAVSIMEEVGKIKQKL